MARIHGRDAGGRPLDLIGQLMRPASSPGVGIVRKDTTTMAKADRHGIYQIGKARFKIRAGDIIPEGGEMVEAESEERSKGKAPEDKSLKGAPDNKSQGKDSH